MGWRDTVSEYMQRAKEETVFFVKQEMGKTAEVNETFWDMSTYPGQFVDEYVNGEKDNLGAGIEELEERRQSYLSAVRKHKSHVDEDRAYIDAASLVVTAYTEAAERAATYLTALEKAQTGDADADEETVDTLTQALSTGDRPSRYETREEREQRERNEAVQTTVQDFTYMLDTLEESVGSFSGIDSVVANLDEYATELFDTYETVDRCLDLVEEAEARMEDADTDYSRSRYGADIDVDTARQELQGLQQQLVDDITAKEQELRENRETLQEQADNPEAVDTAIDKLQTYRERLEASDDQE